MHSQVLVSSEACHRHCQERSTARNAVLWGKWGHWAASAALTLQVRLKTSSAEGSCRQGSCPGTIARMHSNGTGGCPRQSVSAPHRAQHNICWALIVQLTWRGGSRM